MSSTIDTPKKRQNLIAEIWNGEAGLAITYWVYGVAAGFFWGFAFRVFNVDDRSSAGMALWICLIAYYCVVYVGTWRAAEKYTGRRLWAILAKCAVVLGALRLCYDVFRSVFQ